MAKTERAEQENAMWSWFGRQGARDEHRASRIDPITALRQE